VPLALRPRPLRGAGWREAGHAHGAAGAKYPARGAGRGTRGGGDCACSFFQPELRWLEQAGAAGRGLAVGGEQDVGAGRALPAPSSDQCWSVRSRRPCEPRSTGSWGCERLGAAARLCLEGSSGSDLGKGKRGSRG
jgi:hypothetical protein